MKKVILGAIILLLMASCATKKQVGISDQDKQRIDQEYDQYKQGMK